MAGALPGFGPRPRYCLPAVPLTWHWRVVANCWVCFLGNFCGNMIVCLQSGHTRAAGSGEWAPCEPHPSWDGRLSSAGCPGAFPPPRAPCAEQGSLRGAVGCPRAQGGRMVGTRRPRPRAHPCFASQAQTDPALRRETRSQRQKFLCLEASGCAALGEGTENGSGLRQSARLPLQHWAGASRPGQGSLCGGARAAPGFRRAITAAGCTDLLIRGSLGLRLILIH